MNLPIKGALGNWVVGLGAAVVAGFKVYTANPHDIPSAVIAALMAFAPAFYHNTKGDPTAPAQNPQQ